MPHRPRRYIVTGCYTDEAQVTQDCVMATSREQAINTVKAVRELGSGDWYNDGAHTFEEELKHVTKTMELTPEQIEDSWAETRSSLGVDQCAVCATLFNDGEDGWDDLCPSCADRVSELMDEENIDRPEAVSKVQAVHR
jgi:hypothetical protein